MKHSVRTSCATVSHTLNPLITQFITHK